MIENKEKIAGKWQGMDDSTAEKKILGKSSSSSSPKRSSSKKKTRKKPSAEISLDEESEEDNNSDGSIAFDTSDHSFSGELSLPSEDDYELEEEDDQFSSFADEDMDDYDSEEESIVKKKPHLIFKSHERKSKQKVPDSESSESGEDDSDSYDPDSFSSSDSDDDPSDSDDENEELPLREVLRQFAIMRRKYKIKVPDFNEYSDPKIANTSLQRIKFECSLDSNVLWYKRYFIYSSIMIEYMLVYFGGLDMQEMTKYHVSLLDQYDELLVELGERKYTSFIGSLPIEFRLIGLFAFNSIIYFVGKNYFPDFLGMNLEQLMGAMDGISKGLTGPPRTSTPTVSSGMKPPSFTADDIRDV